MSTSSRHEGGPWDVFVSYCREDNMAVAGGKGWVDDIIEQLEASHAEFFPGDTLRIFIDRHSIGTEDWRARLYEGIGNSRYMIAFLTDNYISPKHPNCAWEWDTFERRERSIGLFGKAIAPVYFVLKPDGPDRVAEEQRIAEWLNAGNRRWRNEVRMDEKSWCSAGDPFVPLDPTGLDGIQHEAIRKKLRMLDEEIVSKRKLADQVERTPSTIPQHNPNFVGRTEQLRQLRYSLMERPAVVTNGLGGVGKTALACEYAHVFAHAYPGGLFWVWCEKHDDLATALLQLGNARELGENVAGLYWGKESSEADQRIILRNWLNAQGQQGGRRLIVLDNVDRVDFLTRDAVDKLGIQNRDLVHFLATSREELSGVARMALDELSEDEGVELIRRRCMEYADDGAGRVWREEKRVLSKEDFGYIREIVRDLGGFTLAVEGVAVHFAEQPLVSIKGFRDNLRQNGITEYENAAAKKHVQLHSHREKSLELTWGPTIESLSKLEIQALRTAVCFPPDAVPLAWVREMLGRVDGTAGIQDAPVYGREDEHPWLRIQKRLEALRLLVPNREGLRPNEQAYSARYHRALGGLLRKDDSFPKELVEAAWQFTLEKMGGLYERVHLKEVKELLSSIRQIVDSGLATATPRDSGLAMNGLALVEQALGNLPRAKELLENALHINEAAYEPTHPTLAISYSNLALVEQALGNLPRAKELLENALHINEEAYEPTHPTLAIRYSNLAMVEQDLGNLPRAKELLERAIRIEEAAYEPTHPTLAISYSNLAAVEKDLGNLPRAKELLENALRIKEAAYEPTHPTLATSYSNLAMVEKDLGNLPRAKELLEKAIRINEAAYEPTHPTLAIRYNNMAHVEWALGNRERACMLMRRAYEILDLHKLPNARHAATWLAEHCDKGGRPGHNRRSRPWRWLGLLALILVSILFLARCH